MMQILNANGHDVREIMQMIWRDWLYSNEAFENFCNSSCEPILNFANLIIRPRLVKIHLDKKTKIRVHEQGFL